MRGLPIILLVLSACTFGGRDEPAPEPQPEPCEDGTAPPCRDVEPPGLTDPLLETGVGRLAGQALAGDRNGDRSVASFDDPVNVLVLPDGDVLVADFNNNQLRRVSPTGEVTSLTETAIEGFNRPFGMVLMPDGTLFIQTDFNRTGDQGPDNGAIWSLNLDGETALVANNTGRLRGMVPLEDGRLFVTDYLNHYVGIFDPTSGAITPLAGVRGEGGFADGAGDVARFNTPYDVIQLPDGDFLIADFDNHCLRRVTLEGVVSTYSGVCGTDGDAVGTLEEARYFRPQGLAIDNSETIYVTDIDNYKIRRIRDGQVTTIAGDGMPGFVDGPPLEARFFGLEGLDVTPDGTILYVADGDRGLGEPFHRVRRIVIEEDEAGAGDAGDAGDDGDDGAPPPGA